MWKVYFTEDTYEQAVISLFEGMEYEHIYAPDLERDYSRPLMDSVLWDSLVRINHGLPKEAIQKAIQKLNTFENGSLVQKNRIFTAYLQNGVEVKYYEKGEERSGIVYLIDYQDITKNLLLVFFVKNNKNSGYNAKEAIRY